MSWLNNIYVWARNFVVTVINAIVSFLPDTPFKEIETSAISGYMGNINWVIPVGTIIGITAVWVSAILMYYGYSVILRWVKAQQ